MVPCSLHPRRHRSDPAVQSTPPPAGDPTGGVTVADLVGSALRRRRPSRSPPPPHPRFIPVAVGLHPGGSRRTGARDPTGGGSSRRRRGGGAWAAASGGPVLDFFSSPFFSPRRRWVLVAAGGRGMRATAWWCQAVGLGGRLLCARWEQWHGSRPV